MLCALARALQSASDDKDEPTVATTLDTLSSAAQLEAEALGLTHPFHDLPSEVGFAAWFARIEENYRAIAVAECKAVFDRYQGLEAGDLDRFRALNAFFCFDEMVERHCEANLDDLKGLAARRVTLFLEQLVQFKVAGDPATAESQTPLEARFMAFRAEVGGQARTLGQLNQLVKRADDRAERQAAWEAFVPLGAANREDYLALVRTRNRLAQRLGFRDFVDMRWRQSGIDETWILGVLDRLEVETRAPYEAACADLKQILGVDKLEPWDMAYGVDRVSPLPPETFERKGAKDRLETLLAGWGFAQSELGLPVYECDAFTMGGLCFGIEPGKEVAVLISPTDGPRFYRTYFHEYGHAMHFRHVGQGAMLLNIEDMAFNEGMAVFFESFVSDPDWVREAFPELSEADRARYITHARYAALTWMRTLLANVRFEHALYSDPDVEPDALWLSLQASCGGFDLQASFGPRWAADQMSVSLPVNWHNYVIAELIAKQTREAIVTRDGSLISNPKVRDFLFEHYYMPGASLPWLDKVASATGTPLSADAFFRAFAQA